MTSKLSVTRIKCDIGASDLLPTGNNETAIHILTGRCSVAVGDKFGERTYRNLGGRTNPFAQLPTTVFIGPNSEFKVVSEGYCDLLVAKHQIPDATYCPTVVVRPDDIQVHRIGDSTHLRIVREIGGANLPPYTMRLGETKNIKGGWSSWPVHAGEVATQGFEEYFYYICNPLTGFGVQLNNDDSPMIVRSGDLHPITKGYHPVVAEPSTELMYVWVHASDDGFSKKYSKFSDEPVGLYSI